MMEELHLITSELGTMTTAITNSSEQVEQTFQEFQQMQHISTAVKVQSDQLNRII